MVMRAQLNAIRAAGVQAPPHDLSKVDPPVLVANGDNDLMVSSEKSAELARRLSNAELVIYPDSGHGGLFQQHRLFVPKALDFLES
jgi:pimeloyl-ACP methyl ester carboxylesterase